MLTQPYPLLPEPILKEKVWGGRRLAGLGKDLPEGVLIGESWEVADLAMTDPGGGGGEPAHSAVSNGALAGWTLVDSLAAMGDDVGEAFPLLVKLLDAGQHLSVQVHPDAAHVASHPDAVLKEEVWVVVDAAPDAVLFLGLENAVTREQIEHAAAAGSIAPLLRAVPAVVGDCHHLPPGTVHALGAGVMVAEVQTPSDTTYRLYDWEVELGRSGRRLHVGEALDCLRLDPPPPPARFPERGSALLADTGRFWVGATALDEGPVLEAQAPSWRVALVVGGTAQLSAGDDSFTPLRVDAGTTVVLPRSVARRAVWHGSPAATLVTTGVGEPGLPS